ncbi:MAG: carboxynorspermidine decarboxylase [Cellvibrionaceae bacterium]
MESYTFKHFDSSRVPSPCFVIDEVVVENNLRILNRLQEESGAKILAALKAFSCWHLGELSQRYLSGICASGYHEAQLGYDEYTCQGKQGEVHVFSSAFSDNEFQKTVPLADHIIFNSFSQWQRFKQRAICVKQEKDIDFGLRINPEHSEGSTAIYDPCAAGSRLGIPISQFSDQDLEGISGLHFHTLCEQGLIPLKRTLAAVEEKFADYLPQMQWVNFGGGHHISHPDYDVDGLIQLIRTFAKKYQVQVYLEPGEAIAIRSGVLVAEVLDIMQTDRTHAILDTSATCHMPDTLEMPYRAYIANSGLMDEKQHPYRLGGMTCLAGDIIGDYSFDKPLQIGDRLLFDDMSHYTMVKTSTFNGVQLPAIAIWNSKTNTLKTLKEFTHDDFKHRLS